MMYTFKAYGRHYGIPQSFEEELRKGNDGILIVSNQDVLKPITKLFEHRFLGGFVVPVLLYAPAGNIRQRLRARETNKKQYRARRKELEKEMRRYEAVQVSFKYVVMNDSPFYQPKELDSRKLSELTNVVLRLRQIIIRT